MIQESIGVVQEATTWDWNQIMPYVPYVAGGLVGLFIFGKVVKPVLYAGRKVASGVVGMSPGAMAAAAGVSGPLGAHYLGQEFGGYGIASAFIGMSLLVVFCTITQIRRWYKVPSTTAIKETLADIKVALLSPTDKEERETALNRAKDRLSSFV